MIFLFSILILLYKIDFNLIYNKIYDNALIIKKLTI